MGLEGGVEGQMGGGELTVGPTAAFKYFRKCRNFELQSKCQLIEDLSRTNYRLCSKVYGYQAVNLNYSQAHFWTP